jgi:hypothetical protein
MTISGARTEAGQWSKSSYSGGNETECLECAISDHTVMIRDSKHPTLAALRVPSSWRSFVAAVRHGEGISG